MVIALGCTEVSHSNPKNYMYAETALSYDLEKQRVFLCSELMKSLNSCSVRFTKIGHSSSHISLK